MKKILTASSNPELIDTVKYACQLFSSIFTAEVFDDTDEIIKYIDYELPEIKVLDFTSEDIDCFRILEEINRDGWLHNGGIIAVCKDHKSVKQMEDMKDTNMLTIQTMGEFVDHFTRILRILWQNQKFLFNRGMRDTFGGEESGTFVFGNDPMDMQFYTNFLVSYLYNTNRISNDDRFSLKLTFNELLTNALEHGNLEISSEEKQQWLEGGNDIMSLIREKSKMSEFASRKIRISYIIGQSSSKFAIRDDGKGFDWRACTGEKSLVEAVGESGLGEDGAGVDGDVSDMLPGEEMLHGRGIVVSKSLVRSLVYNEKGNEVAFIIGNLQNASNSVPTAMKPFETVTYSNKEVVCREGDMSNDLYFIVSGRFAVYSGNKLATVLTPNDLFIGEMAFLLNDRRTATVIAVGECELIRMHKTDFLVLIRKNPHYGIFLSKMLAQRLVRQTKQTIDLKNSQK